MDASRFTVKWVFEKMKIVLLNHAVGGFQVAVNWCICKGTIPIPGVKSLRQVEENLGALGWRLSKEEVLELEAAAASISNGMIQNIFQTK
jgi:pyridoxine 4-dehydrogenase